MPNQGSQEKGQAIASAFEKGVADHNMKPAIDALQEAAHGDPRQYQDALKIANQMLDNSNNPKVKQFFGKFDLVDGSDNSLVLKRDDGAKFKMDAHGTTTAENGAKIEATTRDSKGNRVEKVTDKDGTVRERETSADGNSSVEKFTDKSGNHWEIERRKQADGTLRPTKVTMPDGSKMEYEWKQEYGDHGTLYPTHMRETNPNNKVVRDIEMNMVAGSNRLNTASWHKNVGPETDNFGGTVLVDSNGNNTLTVRDPYMQMQVNADGNWKKTSFSGGKLNQEHDRRTK